MTASAFSKAITTVPKGRPGPPCPVAAILDQLDKASRADAEAAIAAKQTYTARQIVAALDALGHVIVKEKVGIHRRGDCRCTR